MERRCVDLAYEARARNRSDGGETRRSVDARLRVVDGDGCKA